MICRLNFGLVAPLVPTRDRSSARPIHVHWNTDARFFAGEHLTFGTATVQTKPCFTMTRAHMRRGDCAFFRCSHRRRFTDEANWTLLSSELACTEKFVYVQYICVLIWYRVIARNRRQTHRRLFQPMCTRCCLKTQNKKR